MNTLPSHSRVIIVGAGPSGLIMAAQLLRHGVQPIIIDSKTSPTSESRALAIQARSLEIFRQMGIEELFLMEGNLASEVVLHQNTEELVRVDFQSSADDSTFFPFVLILEQSKTERILIDYLTSNACPIYWNTTLLNVYQTDKRVNLKISRNDAEELLSCDWLVGADGASSVVRKSLNIPFTGSTYEHAFFLADLQLNSDFTSNTIQIFFKEVGFTGMFPMKAGGYRFIGMLPRVLKGKKGLTFQDLKPYLTYNLDFALTDDCCTWFSTYQIHHRVADRFKSQRCFLIGDAAHIHSPVGGQGMNTGLQDAYNLSWKLAGVIEGRFSDTILDTYQIERMPVAKKLLQTTDRIFNLAISKSWLVQTIRYWLLPQLINRFIKSKNFNKRVIKIISQLQIAYRNSSLSVDHSQAKRIKAGDRLPYITFYNEKLKKNTDLHSWCTQTGFTLIVIGTLGQRDILALAKWIKLSYPFGLQFFYLPYSKRNKNLFDHFEMVENSRKAIIVRPDMHIGYLNDIVDTELLNEYFQQAVGWK